jgi:hypothetical protein
VVCDVADRAGVFTDVGVVGAGRGGWWEPAGGEAASALAGGQAIRIVTGLK